MYEKKKFQKFHNMAKSNFFRFDANVTPQGVTKSKKFFASSNFMVVINPNLQNMIKFGE